MKLKIQTNGKGTVTEVLVDGVEAKKLDSSSHCRQVFVCEDKYVIKFDTSPEDEEYDRYDKVWKQTTYELRFLNKIQLEDLEFFALPLKSGKTKGLSYTVQEYYKKGRSSRKKVSLMRKIAKKYGLDDLYFHNHDGWYKNFEFTNNGIKIYDYAPV